MAQKKENKMIGYLVISVIPILGIVWAGVEGILHNKYVKDVIAVEESFEKHFVEKLNSIEKTNVPTLNKVLEDKKLAEDKYAAISFPKDIVSADIVSIVPYSYGAKLDADPFASSSTNPSSYTVRVGANLIAGATDEAAAIYGIDFEFMIDYATYESFTANYDKDFITTLGEKQYTYETYYNDNPRNSPIYKLVEHFDNYYLNVLNYEYNEVDVVSLTGASAVIDMINTIGEVTLEDLELLDKIKALYDILPQAEKDSVSNYSIYEEAVKYCRVLSFIEQVANLPSEDELINDYVQYGVDIENAMKAYEIIVGSYTEEEFAELPLEDTIEHYEQMVLTLGHSKFFYYVDGAREEGISDSQFKTRAKGAVNAYNESLTVEQKHLISEEYYGYLHAIIEKYNAFYPNSPRRHLVLEGIDEEEKEETTEE